ncbi:LOW QUALITY PROTEIN: hypothetical protein Mucpa_6868 [Mucilaginibacter paludis DSM 18603]|uniref:Uncharacterized protein n=1 Tax=Mucilaginibacter paludis DSM 18603 TaxID=714943 RepID=H1Y3X2_9SPHI|nr:LOW QUALITY PROTEIN: hypothetical protein Mucpa_6868 [Mucilaginibacter paludis DSM 18603]
MEIPLTTLQLRTIVREAAELGAIIALVRTGKLPSYLNREAYRRYGRRTIEQLLAKGELGIRSDGNHSAAWRIDRIEIEAIVRGLEIWRQL